MAHPHPKFWGVPPPLGILLKVDGFGTNVLLASTDLSPGFSLSASSGAHTYQRLETILINPLTIEIRISQMFPRPEVQRDYSEGEKDIFFVCVTPPVLNILRWLP